MKICLPRKVFTLKKLLLGCLAMFISCWITVLVIQNYPDTNLSNSQTMSQQKLPFLHHKQLPRDSNTHPRNKVPKEKIINQNSVNKNIPSDTIHKAKVPRKVLLSNGELAAFNTSLSRTKPSPFKVIARLNSLPSMNGPSSLELLRERLVLLNQQEIVLNSNKFPPLESDDIVLIVQAHKRVGYLKQLLDSLRVARDIDKVLLVVSHDYYFDEMNQLVETVDFCKVLQIFYPFSLQVFPDIFPGQSSNDCPRDIQKDKAIETNCTNAHHPDSFGHYREAPVTAIKHHWWWKVNTVFDNMQVTSGFNGYVFFLEEDHYVSPDFVVAAKKLIALKEAQCEDCDFINMGTYHSKNSFSGASSQASTSFWNAGRNNMGFGMDRSSWNTIKGCSEKFCVYDDYNWDWSLNSLGDSCLHRKLKVLVLNAPRILHIGTCGTHHHRSCNEAEQARVAKTKYANEAAYLFPDFLTLVRAGSGSSRPLKNYGGWGDIRDHELCRSFVKS